jgi:hypothetical protein
MDAGSVTACVREMVASKASGMPAEGGRNAIVLQDIDRQRDKTFPPKLSRVRVPNLQERFYKAENGNYNLREKR